MVVVWMVVFILAMCIVVRGFAVRRVQVLPRAISPVPFLRLSIPVEPVFGIRPVADHNAANLHLVNPAIWKQAQLQAIHISVDNELRLVVRAERSVIAKLQAHDRNASRCLLNQSLKEFITLRFCVVREKMPQAFLRRSITWRREQAVETL
jgi:hypothetical protein